MASAARSRPVSGSRRIRPTHSASTPGPATAKRMSVDLPDGPRALGAAGAGRASDVGPQWQQFRLTFLAARDDTEARLTFATSGRASTNWQPSRCGPAARSAWMPASGSRTTRCPFCARRPAHIGRAGATIFRFHLRHRTPATGRACIASSKTSWASARWSPARSWAIAAAGIQAGLDYIDSHAYWHHPVFPGLRLGPGTGSS